MADIDPAAVLKDPVKTPELGDPDIAAPSANTPPTVGERIRSSQKAQKAAIEGRAFQGTAASSELAHREAVEASSTDLLGAGFRGTAAYGIYRYADQEMGQADDPTYRRADHFHELTKNIPFQYHDEIMDAGSLEAAQRVRGRIEEDFRDLSLLSNAGAPGTAALMAGGLLDIDIVAALASNGTYTAAKLSRLSMMATRLGVGAKTASKAAHVAGVSLEAGAMGALVGGANATVRETGDWMDVPAIALTTAAFGAGIGTLTKPKAARAALLRREHDNYVERWGNDPTLGEIPNVHATAEATFGKGAAADEAAARVDPGVQTREQMEAGADADRTSNMIADLKAGQKAPSTPVDAARRAAFLERIALRSGMGKRELERMSPEAIAKVDATLEARRLAAGRTGENAPKAGDDFNPNSIGAAGNNRAPQMDGSKEIQSKIEDAMLWRESSGFNAKAFDEAGQWYTKALNHMDRVGLAGDFHKLYSSRAATANWTAVNLFESPSGLGRQGVTAATRQEGYHARIMTRFAEPYTNHLKTWARDNGQTQFGGLHVTDEASRAFGRTVHMEVNARRLGRTSGQTNPSVIAAADAIEEAAQEAYNIAKGRNGETSVDGFEDVVQKAGYSPMIWRGRAMRDIAGTDSRAKADLIGSIEDGYVSAGIPRDVASKIAKAVYNRAVRSDEGFDMSLVNLLRADGSEHLKDVLTDGRGMSPAEADRIIDALRGPLSERSKEGFVKSRNEIDLSTPLRGDLQGRTLVDLMDNDMTSVWSRYSRQVSGSSALARSGLVNKQARRELIDAIRTEQRYLGEEHFPDELLDDMFTHFDAGPIAGGVTPWVMRAKRLTNLSLLNKLGLTQGGEMGAVIAAGGWENFLAHSKAFSKSLDDVIADAKSPNPKGLLDELKPLMGDIGKDHQFFRDDLALDETRMSASDHSYLTGMLDKVLSKGSRVQGFMSGFYHVRQAQQRIAVSTMADKTLQMLRAGVPVGGHRRLNDIGIPEDVQWKIHDEAFVNKTVEFKDKWVNRLNIDQWDWEVAEVFSNALHRHQNQVVQKAMAGEDGVWMHKSTASLLTHLKTFPLLAISKQGIRHARMQDPAAIATLFMGLGTAGLAYIVKQLVDGKTDRLDPVSVMQGAFGMSNMTGFVPMMTDPVATMFGLDSLRFNQYGPHTELSVPALEVGNRLLRAPGALGKLINPMQDADGYDRQAIRSIPAMNYFGISILTDQIGR